MTFINFQIFSKITFALIFLVIIAGSIVRMSGSGMGCPDWPKCFDMWIPPTDVSQLPDNYQDVYKDRGYATTEFNVLHTWTEYINRLIGALAGFFTLVLFILSFNQKNKLIIFLATMVVFSMGVQAWLGGVVVQSVLEPFKITIHMIMAVFILCLMLIIINKSSNFQFVKENTSFKRVLLAFIVISFIQILLGTSVRESIDVIAKQFNFEFRDLWVAELGLSFKIHRSFSIIVITVALYYVFLSLKNNLFIKHLKLIIGLLFTEILIGVFMAYFSIPFYLQPIHLIFAISLFTVQTDVLIKYIMSPKQ